MENNFINLQYGVKCEKRKFLFYLGDDNNLTRFIINAPGFIDGSF